MINESLKHIDTKEIELPETVFIRDIETKVFQSICIQVLSKITGVDLLEANILDNLLGRDSAEGSKGIHVNQDQKSHSVNIKIELNIEYGICIPEKAEEIQSKIAEEVSSLTGLHVATVHVIFKNLIPFKTQQSKKESSQQDLELVKG